MDAIKALASATPVDPAYPLLDIFVHHRLAEYRAHVTAHPAVFTTLHLDEKACTAKMRLVSLAALAAEHLGEALAYGEVARMVEVGEDEVELWVIDAIRRGLIEAKMDQVKRTVVVGYVAVVRERMSDHAWVELDNVLRSLHSRSRSTYRIFGAEQWQLLEKKLVDWQAGLDHIERVLDNVQDMVESEMPPAMV